MRRSPKSEVLAAYPRAICAETRYGYIVWAEPGYTLERLDGTESGQDLPNTAMQAWHRAAQRLRKEKK